MANADSAASGERVFHLQKRETFKIVDVDSVKPVDAVIFECRRERHIENLLSSSRGFEQGKKGSELGGFGVNNR
jgi:hypothetical protein